MLPRAVLNNALKSLLNIHAAGSSSSSNGSKVLGRKLEAKMAETRVILCNKRCHSTFIFQG